MSSTPPPASPTSVTPSSDEPGWFGDGEGNQRFWDGARWTTLVSSRRVFPGRASSTPEPRLISESPLPADYLPGVTPLTPASASAPASVGEDADAPADAPSSDAPSAGPRLAPPTGDPVAPPAGYPLAPPTGDPVAPPLGAPLTPPADLPAPPNPAAPTAASPVPSSMAGAFAAREAVPAPPRAATTAASAPTSRTTTTAPALRGRSTWPWAALAVAAVLVVAAAVIAGIPGLLIALGVVALIAGLIPLIRSGSAWIPGVRTRATGGVAAGLALVLIAGGAVAATLPDADGDTVADPETIEISDARPVPDATDPANPLPVSADGLVEVVDVTRMQAVDAGDTLAAAGFGIAFAGTGGSALVRQDVGIVASQDPAAGTRVAPGATVTLTLAVPAPDRIALPVVPKAPGVPSRPGTRPGTGPFTPGTGGGGSTNPGTGAGQDGGSGGGVGGGGPGDGGSGDGGSTPVPEETGSTPAPTEDPGDGGTDPVPSPVPTPDQPSPAPSPVPTPDLPDLPDLPGDPGTPEPQPSSDAGLPIGG
ncbi:PASTA domain-containing protein [Clavibacter zhangzhiyongii]|uniref:PASTA domain-containing protein n=1 Tax=Clavibacter zhangzhiyongii TaxID=2768071 RepID=UPI0039E1CF06